MLGGLGLFDLGDVLTHANDADDVAVDVAPGSRIQQHIDAPLVLGEQGKLVVRGLRPAQRRLQDVMHRSLVVVGNELPDQVAPHDLVLGIAGDVGRLLVPLVDPPPDVNAENRRVRRVDELRQLGRGIYTGPVQRLFGSHIPDQSGVQRCVCPRIHGSANLYVYRELMPIPMHCRHILSMIRIIQGPTPSLN